MSDHCPERPHIPGNWSLVAIVGGGGGGAAAVVMPPCVLNDLYFKTTYKIRQHSLGAMVVVK